MGGIDATDCEDALKEWQYSGHKPSLLLRSKAKQLGHFARVFLGLEYTAEQKLAYEATQEAHGRAVALRASTPAPPAVIQQTVADPAASGWCMARFKDIADAARSGEVAVMEFKPHSACIARFRKVMHAKKVPEHCEPTAAQLTVLQAYVGFGIWGPFANCIAQALRGSGLMFNADMELVTEQYKVHRASSIGRRVGKYSRLRLLYWELPTRR